MTHTTFTPVFTTFAWLHPSTLGGIAPTFANRIAAQDANLTYPVSATFDNILVLGAQIQETGGAAGASTDDWQLQYSLNSGTYTDVNSTSSYVKSPNKIYSSLITTNASNATEYPIYGGTAGSGETEQGQGQSFTTSGSAITIKSITCFCTANGSPTDDLTFSIEDAISGGNVLGSNTVPNAFLTEANGGYLYLEISAALSASTTYYLKVTRTGSRDATNYFSLHGGADGYAGGTRYTLDNTTWSSAANDIRVQLYDGSVQDSDGSAVGNYTNLTDGTGTFQNGVADTNNGQVTDYAISADQWTDHAFYLQLVHADLSDGDTLDFRITLNGGDPGFTNSVTPRITVSKLSNTTGTAASTLQAPTVSASGWIETTGTVASTLPSLSVSATGNVVVPITGTVAATLQAPTVGAAGALKFEGSAVLTLPSLTVDAAGGLAFSGSAAINLAAPTVSASGDLKFIGSAAAALQPPTVSSTGWAEITGSIAVSLPMLVAALEGSVTNSTVTGTAASVLQAPTVDISGELKFEGAAAADLGAVTVSAAGEQKFIGTVGVNLQAVSVSADGALRFTGEASVGLGAVQTAVAGELRFTGTAAPTLAAPEVSAGGTYTPLAISGTVAAALRALAVSISGNNSAAPPAAEAAWRVIERRRRK